MFETIFHCFYLYLFYLLEKRNLISRSQVDADSPTQPDDLTLDETNANHQGKLYSFNYSIILAIPFRLITSLLNFTLKF